MKLVGEADANSAPEQYKLYVEIAHRLSARRSLANTISLTLTQPCSR